MSGIAKLAFVAMIGLQLPIRLARGDDVSLRSSIQPRWISTRLPFQNTDSLAIFQTESEVRVAATSKEGHRVDIYDAQSGTYLDSVGVFGGEAGELSRPNGIAALGATAESSASHLAVIERDNHRVTLFSLPKLQPVLVFGEAQLQRPYGCTVAYLDNECHLFVTDTNVATDETVKHFVVSLRPDHPSARHVGHFGVASGPGRILTAESIAWDSQHQVLLICDEHPSQRNVKIYTPDGRFTGETMADRLIQGQPEGIAVVPKLRDTGIVFLVDQLDHTTALLIFEARTRRLLKRQEMGNALINTDGICVWPQAFASFSSGAVIGVFDDSELRAFSLEEILNEVPQ